MIETKILNFVNDHLQADANLTSILGADWEMFLQFGERRPSFPYMIHKVDMEMFVNSHIWKGRYHLDIYDYNLDRTRLYQAVHRVRVLLDRTMDPSGGGLRFFYRNVNYDTQHEWVQRAMLIFAFRGVDVDFVADST